MRYTKRNSILNMNLGVEFLVCTQQATNLRETVSTLVHVSIDHIPCSGNWLNFGLLELAIDLLSYKE